MNLNFCVCVFVYVKSELVWVPGTLEEVRGHDVESILPFHLYVDSGD